MRIAEADLREDRYSRLRLIPWWDHSKIVACRLLVVGAGALGNEILKNAALLGFRKVVVVDLDRIEESNLSRTVLYRGENINAVSVCSNGATSSSPVSTIGRRDCGSTARHGK